MNKISTFALTAALAAPAFGQGLQITEVYAGVTGEDGTEDWFELTNFGPGPISTGGLFYDDESADPTVDAPLTDFTLDVGERAIFLQGGNATDIADFVAIWGDVLNVGVAAGGGGLSQNGDEIFIFDGNIAGAGIVESVSFGSGFANQGATISFDVAGNASLTQLSDPGAYESAMFFNDNIGGDDEMISIIGSPPIPEPATAGLLVAGAVGLLARRRRV
jgi:hypothetical protein